MLLIKALFLWVVKAMYFSNPFGITLIFTSNLPISCIIKWLTYSFKLWDITGTFLVNLKEQNSNKRAPTPKSRTSIFSCYMIMISYFIISCNKWFIAYPAFITWLKSSFIFFRHDEIFIKILSWYILPMFYFFKNCFNKFIDFSFSSVKKQLVW